MFYSQCLLSRKGPLASVWVAAYCHKRLKKYQITHTDIAFSVDKILVEGVPTITYRVLGYLLLGVVRIYGKKVKYLFDDCHKVLTNINKLFRGKNVYEQEDSHRAPYYSITFPDCFELDTFELELNEDLDGSTHQLPPGEEIMLKDTWGKKGTWNFTEKYVALTVDTETFSMTDVLSEDVLSPHLKGSDLATSISHTLHNSEANMDLERLRDDRFSEINGLDFEMLLPLKESLSIPDKNSKEQQIVKEINVPEMEMADIAEARTQPEHQNQSDSEENTDHHHEIYFFQEECKHFEICCDSGGQSPDHARLSGANANDAKQTLLSEGSNVEKINSNTTTKERQLFFSVSTPKTKFPDASGALTPETMTIATPAHKVRAQRRTLRKRKCSLDKEIVLPNKVLKEWLDDSSDLVRKRVKLPHTVLDTWKACWIPKLSQDFLLPLTPGTSLEIDILLRSRECKSKEPVENVEASEKLDFPGNVEASDLTALAPETPAQIPAKKATLRSPEELDLPRSPIAANVCSTQVELFKGADETTTFSDSVRPACSGTVDKDPYFNAYREFDIDLMNEEIGTSSEEACADEMNGWSLRTRTVASYLKRHFLYRKGRGEKEAVNLMEVLKGRNKKESARLFYEILVLKSNGFVDVKQDDAFGNITVEEHP